ncbi:MAG: transglutaminase family protein, partial [Chloroflexota bacterium]
MSILAGINHKTQYTYDRPVSLSPHIFRLRPAPHSRTPINAYSLTIRPENHFINWQQDPFGNYLARVVFPEKATELFMEVDLVADMTVINPFDFFVEESAEFYPFEYGELEQKELAPYFEIKESGEHLTTWLATIPREKEKIIDFLVSVNQSLWKRLDYTVRMEPGVQSCEETLGSSIGSCRDFAWVLVQAARHLGLAARFVSGYLIQLTADQKSLDGPSGPEQDFTDLHAWAEIFIPGAGWVGLDPTSGLFAAEGHIPLACTPDPASAAPVTGALDPCEVTFAYDNKVQRIHEDPRVTKPYTEQQWSAIQALAHQVDAELVENDVRLTMGGEPTFVSIDDMEAAEWNTAADGPQKRQLASDLVRRLQNSFGQGGMLYYGQGKWYPGEELPRWKLAAYWRIDGVKMWRNPALQARLDVDYGHTPADAERFLRRLAQRIKQPERYVIPAHEDIFYMLWSEGRVPVNVDPLESDLSDSLERRRLADLLDQGLNQPSGYVLPLRWHYTSASWVSGPWLLRRKHLFLMPGDSPIGLRLPLESLPWVAEEDRIPHFERDPLEYDQSNVPNLPDFYTLLEETSTSDPEEIVLTAPEPKEVPHTALSIEPRGGKLFIFMPPLDYLEHYLSLIAIIEKTAEELDLPIVIEGYEPPTDWRLKKILVTPDPGVIEVNIHPAGSWDELEAITTTLYEDARQSRLGTEKFMLDGHHTGTGGGNHVTMGGITPSDSPFLRRPDLLRSFVTYWQHHPGLSYLFSGRFIGPTSQAPRVDEGRVDSLYELEIAFNQIPEPGTEVPPWVVDRIMRNQLVDLTGNTHRAEFCIDKLYSPDRAGGRLGLVEFRAFEMPPHARMSLAQMLLVRSLLAMFWDTPYKHKLVRWGTELYDRFLLPHYVMQDLYEVLDDLQRAGYQYETAWLDPFYEFRFPRFGTVQVREIELELRMAIEPWNVLGEEVTNLGTARFVDSSVERLQVKISGLNDARFVVTCNGIQLPLRKTEVKGEFVAGVRYQAWQPPSSLHPTIGIHAPLVFDIVDTWNQRSIGGCTYHVVHPGGRNYDVFPINANVA